jgi:hypothetical protein
MNPHFFTPDVFGIAVDQAYTSPPGQPSVTANNPTATVPNFVVTSEIPLSGIINAMELWYGQTNTTPFDTTWNLLETTRGNGEPFTNSTTSTQYYVNFDVTGLNGGTYYFATRVYGVNGYSQFSDISTSSFTWTPNVSAQTSVDSTNAQNVQMNSGSGDYFITHSSASSGNAPQYADTSLKYNSTNKTLTTPKLSATTGTVTTMNINAGANLAVLTAPPANYTTGTMAMADNNLWYPVTPQTNTGTAYLTVYNGVQWVKLG